MDKTTFFKSYPTKNCNKYKDHQSDFLVLPSTVYALSFLVCTTMIAVLVPFRGKSPRYVENILQPLSL
jgi:hypothetical protein